MPSASAAKNRTRGLGITADPRHQGLERLGPPAFAQHLGGLGAHLGIAVAQQPDQRAHRARRSVGQRRRPARRPALHLAGHHVHARRPDQLSQRPDRVQPRQRRDLRARPRRHLLQGRAAFVSTSANCASSRTRMSACPSSVASSASRAASAQLAADQRPGRRRLRGAGRRLGVTR